MTDDSRDRGGPSWPRLWLIADRSVDDDRLKWVFDQIEPALAASPGRVGVIERDHGGSSDRQRLARLSWLKERLRPHAVPLWVNRRVDLAVALEADGVQLTGRSPPTSFVKRAFPTIGVARSCHALGEAALAVAQQADFVLISPVFAPLSKVNQSRPLGLDGLASVTRALNGRVIALGGMSDDRVSAVMRAGAAGVATIGGVFGSRDPLTAIFTYFAHLYN